MKQDNVFFTLAMIVALFSSMFDPRITIVITGANFIGYLGYKIVVYVRER